MQGINKKLENLRKDHASQLKALMADRDEEIGAFVDKYRFVGRWSHQAPSHRYRDPANGDSTQMPTIPSRRYTSKTDVAAP